MASPCRLQIIGRSKNCGIPGDIDSCSADLPGMFESSLAIDEVYLTFKCSQLASDLNVNEMLYEVLEKQNKMMNQMQSNASLLEWHTHVNNVPPPRPHEGQPPDNPYEYQSVSPRPSTVHASSTPHMPMTFTNIHNSGISFGNGGVHVVNGEQVFRRQ